MCTRNEKYANNRNGIALVISMIFIVIFSSLSLGIMAVSSGSLEMAENHHSAGQALTSAHSGLEVVSYWIEGTRVVQGGDKLATVAAPLVANLGATYDASAGTITVPSITINSQSSENFSALITQPDSDTIQVVITGTRSQITRNVQTSFKTSFSFSEQSNPVFDYGVATRGALNMTGQAEIAGLLAIDAGVYIEGLDPLDGDSFAIGNNASVAGNVTISTTGATGSDEDDPISDHVTVGVEPVNFPVPDPTYFRNLVTFETVIEDNTFEDETVLNNVLIVANSGNINFSSNIVINGLLYIEEGNNVNFAGQCTVNGIIVGEGELDGSTYGSLSFSGQVQTSSVSSLPVDDTRFDGIRDEEGTFIVAPGFSIDMTGQAGDDFNVINGAIAASGISFSGQAGGNFDGTIINYAGDTMNLGGQSSLWFDRSGTTEIPSGFLPDYVLGVVTSSYTEICSL